MKETYRFFLFFREKNNTVQVICEDLKELVQFLARAKSMRQNFNLYLKNWNTKNGDFTDHVKWYITWSVKCMYTIHKGSVKCVYRHYISACIHIQSNDVRYSCAFESIFIFTWNKVIRRQKLLDCIVSVWKFNSIY